MPAPSLPGRRSTTPPHRPPRRAASRGRRGPPRRRSPGTARRYFTSDPEKARSSTRPARASAGPSGTATRSRSGRTQTVSLAPTCSQPWRRARTRASPTARQQDGVDGLDHRLHQVRIPDEAGDEPRGRPLVDLERRADLLEPPARHHPDAVAHGERLALVMGDVDEGRAQAPLEALQLLLQLDAELQVEGESRTASRRTRGSLTRARARATRCCWPPDSSLMRRAPSAPGFTGSTLAARRTDLARGAVAS